MGSKEIDQALKSLGISTQYSTEKPMHHDNEEVIAKLDVASQVAASNARMEKIKKSDTQSKPQENASH